MTSTVTIFVGLALIVAVCFAAAWYVDSRRHRGGGHALRPDDAPVNEERITADEEQYADRTVDPRNRMR